MNNSILTGCTNYWPLQNSLEDKIGTSPSLYCRDLNDSAATPDYITGIMGGAWNVNNKTLVADTSPVSWYSGSWSVRLRAKTNVTSSYYALFSTRNYNTNVTQWWTVGLYQGVIQIEYSANGAGSYFLSTFTPTAGIPFEVVVTHIPTSNHKTDIYVNGVSYGSGTMNVNFGDSSDFCLGKWYFGGGVWDGTISHLQIYNRQLTANEIKLLYLNNKKHLL
jgi:hypothetical protein